MAIDASIYGQIRQPEAFNPLAEMAQFQQLQSAQNQNKLAALGFQDRERAINDANALRGAVRGFGQDTAANYQSLLKTGNLTAAQDYQKKIQEQQKTASEISAKDLETASKRLEVAGQAFGFVRANPTLENAVSTIGYLERNGILSPEQARQYRQTVEASPQAIGQLAEQAFRSTLDAKDQLGQIKVTNLGGTSQTTSVDPVTSRVTVLADAPITQSADNAATQATARANNAATVGAMRDNAQAVRDAANISNGFKNETELRKEFEGLPEIKNYKQAYPAFAAIKDAATRNTPQADINIVYSLAKLYDPTSVVREGEYATVANSPNIPEKVKGYAQYLAGGGKLSPETKKQILAEAESRVGTYRTEADKARSTYENIAKGRDMNLSSVLQATGDAPAGGVTAKATSTGVRKYNPATGKIE